jgi:hypothetical protein
MAKAWPNSLQLPEHLQNMLPEVIVRDPTATSVFLAEGLKPKATGKHMTTREMTATGVWSERDTRESSAASRSGRGLCNGCRPVHRTASRAFGAFFPSPNAGERPLGESTLLRRVPRGAPMKPSALCEGPIWPCPTSACESTTRICNRCALKMLEMPGLDNLFEWRVEFL